MPFSIYGINGILFGMKYPVYLWGAFFSLLHISNLVWHVQLIAVYPV